MHKHSQKITLAVLIIGTILLGLTTLVISLQLQQRQPITDLPPRAAEDICRVTFTVSPDLPVPCEIAFTLATPSASPTVTTTPNPTLTSTPIPTVTNTPTLTPTTNPQCGQTCNPSVANNCPNDHTCVSTGSLANTCVLNACVSNLSLCSSNGCTVNPTVTNTPVNTNTPTPSRTPAPGACNTTCSVNSDCANNLICSGGSCRNPDCSEQPNCACYFVPTPEVPVTGSGTTLVGIGVIAGGIILLLLGLAF